MPKQTKTQKAHLLIIQLKFKNHVDEFRINSWLEKQIILKTGRKMQQKS